MDCFSYLFVSALFLMNSPFFILLFSLLACFSDERAYLSIAALILFFVSKYYFDRNKKDRKVAIYLACSIIFCLTIRFLLGMYFGLKTPIDSNSAVGIEILKANFFNHPFSLFTGFELVWLVFPLSLYSIYRRNYMFAIALFGTYILFSLSAWLVLDVTRSACYIFPLLFLSLYIINKYKPELIGKSGIFISIGCFIIPTMFYVSSCYVNSMDFPLVQYIINKIL